MSFRIRQISETADGREIVRVTQTAASLVSIGRASDCDLPLPDLAVEPLQAVAHMEADGAILVKATGTLGFSVDGAAVQEARIDTARGAELGFGSHRITLARDTDGAALLTIRRVGAISRSAAAMDGERNFSLASALPSKRKMAWAGLLLILIAFIAVPVVSNMTRAAGPKANVMGDENWSSGALSAAHHALEGECTACHVRPFESVRDTACKSCHEKVHDHAPAARIDLARAEPGGGARFLLKVARSFGKPGPGACVDCHTEHEGAGPMQPVKQAFCADCHGTLQSRLRDSALGDAGDFGTAHPQFRALVAVNAAREPAYERVSLDHKPFDVNGLSFDHEAHLAKGGTVARMATSLGAGRGYGAALDCANCHKPAADGVRFLPVDMERDCEACHSLAYDRIGGTVRRLRHGDFAQMVADLRAAERGPSAPVGLGLSGRERPGAIDAASLYRARFGSPALANLPLMQAVSSTGICGECHKIEPRGGDVGAWRVQTVHQTPRYFLHGWFDHKAHQQEDCTSCHGAKTSSAASDLLLPGIETCRDCHLGENAAKADVPSSCVMCHDYHADDGAPWATRQDDRKRGKGMAERSASLWLASADERAGDRGTEGAAP